MPTAVVTFTTPGAPSRESIARVRPYAYALSYEIKFGGNKTVRFMSQPPGAKLISRQYYLPYDNALSGFSPLSLQFLYLCKQCYM